MKRTLLTTLLAISITVAGTTARAGVLDDWGKPALVKKFFIQYRIKFHQQGTHISSITLDRNGKASDVTTADGIWVDKVTGNRLKGDEDKKIWRFEVDDKSGTPILTGELQDGSEFVIAEIE